MNECSMFLRSDLALTEPPTINLRFNYFLQIEIMEPKKLVVIEVSLTP